MRTLTFARLQLTFAGYQLWARSRYAWLAVSLLAATDLTQHNVSGSLPGPVVQANAPVDSLPAPTGRLIARWRFDDGWAAGDLALDDTGVHHGQLTGEDAQWTAAGRSGGAVSLGPSANGFVRLSPSFPKLTAPLTLAAWIQVPNLSGHPNSLVFSEHVPGYPNGCFFGIDEAFRAQGFAGQHHLRDPGERLNDGNWHHLLVSLESSGHLRLYVDGNLSNEAANSGAVIPTEAEAVIGGLDPSSPMGGFFGLIDDLQIYDFAAIPDQARHLFEHPGEALANAGGPEIQILPPAGTYTQSVRVILASGSLLNSRVLRYTTDGTEPDATSPVYQEPLLLTSTARIRARRFDGATPDSATFGSDFEVLRDDPNPSPPGHLLAHHRFEEVVDGVVRDDTGWHQGRLSPAGIHLVPNGVSGRAIAVVAGSDGHVRLGDALPLAQSAYTLSVWIKLAPGDTTLYATIFSKVSSWRPGGYSLTLNVGGHSVHAQGGVGSPVTADTPINDGAWHHLAVTCTDYGRLRLYVDEGGAKAESHVTPIEPTLASTVIGGFDRPPAGGAFNGQIDDLQVYDFALTDEQLDWVRTHPGTPFTSSTLPLPPRVEITKGPEDSTNFVGRSVVFSVETRGTPPLFYQWKFNGQLVVGAENPSLTVTNLSAALSGGYSVVVSNPGGSVESSAAQLTVQPFPDDEGPPRITLQPESVTCDFGQRATFTAAAVGGQPLTYRWIHGSYPFPGAESPTLTLDPVIEGHWGTYKLEVRNALGTAVSQPALLRFRVTTPPTISPNGGQFPGSVLVQLSAPLSFGHLGYTTDGTEPDWQSSRFNGFLHLTQTTTLKVRYFYGSEPVSPVATAIFDIVAPPPASGRLLAHWSFDESTGTTVADSTGRYPGLLSPTGATLGQSGIAGGALKLVRAENGHVGMGDVLPLMNTPFSITWWFQTNPEDNPVDAVFIGKHAAWSHNGYYLGLNAAGGSVLAYVGGVHLATSPRVNDGHWHHAAMVFEPGQTVRVYVDGGPARVSQLSQPVVASAGPLILGGVQEVTPKSRYTGLLDDVQIYGIALSASEVDRLRAHPGQVLDAIEGPALQISPNGGSFDHPIEVTLTSNTSGVEIRYTTDGSDPLPASSLYSGPLRLNEDTVLKVGLFHDGTLVGQIEQATFSIRPPAEARLLAHWRFDEMAGSVANDSAGHFPGTLSSSGAAFVPQGISGGALRLRRSGGGQVVLGDVLALTNTSYSISIWFKVPRGDSTSASVLFSKYSWLQGPGYFLSLNVFSPVAVYLGSDNNLSVHNAVNDEQWHHLVVTSKLGGRARLYLDGGSPMVDVPAPVVPSSPWPARIGASGPDEMTATFEGWLDDIQIYEVALSDAEVATLNETPGFALGSAPVGRPTIQPNGGSFTAPVSITLTPPPDAPLNTVLRYSLDGTPPTPNSMVYSGPFLLASNATLHAAGFVGRSQVTRFTASTFTVQIPKPPTVRAYPKNQIVAQGSDARFYAQTTGSYPLTFTWFKDGQVVSSGSSWELVLRSVAANAAGSYWVQVANSVGSATSSFLELVVTNALPSESRELLARWRFDETSGNRANDDTGRYPGTLSPSGAFFVVEGKSGGALALDAAHNGHVAVGDFLPMTGHSSSVALWVKCGPGPVPASSGFISRHRPGIGTGWFLGVGELRNFAAFTGGTRPLEASSIITDGQWHHVVVSRELTGRTTVYTDGSPAEASQATPAMTTTPATVVIGGFDTGVPSGRFTGVLDDIQIYGFALTEAEVDYLHANPGAVVPTTPSVTTGITPPGGGFIDSVVVTMTTSVANASLHFTLDGTEPSPASPRYGGPFTLNQSATVTAAAFVEGTQQGPVARAEFIVTTQPRLTLLTQPQDQSVEVGGSAHFEVSAQGNGPLRYQWFHNGAPITGAILPTLEISPVASSAAGNYWVAVADSLTNLTSRAARLTVRPAPTPPTAPTIQIPPRDRIATAGDRVVLQVTARGTEPLSYLWFFNHTAIPDATSPELVFDPVTPANAGSYEVVVSNAVASVTSTPGILTVNLAPPPQPPRILTQPTRLSLPEGQPARFDVTAQGTAPFSYQWFVGNSPIANATNASLTIESTQTSDTGHYSVHVSNSAGTALSDGVHLLISPTPRTGAGTVLFINRLGASLNAPVFDQDGTTLLSGPHFVAQLFAGPTAKTLAPIGAPAAFGTDLRAGYWSDAVTTIRYLTNVPPGTTAWVQICVWDLSVAPSFANAVARGEPIGRSSILQVQTGGSGAPPTLPPAIQDLTSFRLFTVAPPTLLSEPSSLTIDSGQALDLRVEALGEDLHFQWYRAGQPIPFATNASLTITPADPSLSGSYFVTIRNAGGELKTQPIDVVVLPDPTPTLVGDLNRNDRRDVGDAIQLLALLGQNRSFLPQEIRAYDVDGSQVIDLADVDTLLAQLVSPPAPSPSPETGVPITAPIEASLDPATVPPGGSVRIRLRLTALEPTPAGLLTTVRYPAAAFVPAGNTPWITGPLLPATARSASHWPSPAPAGDGPAELRWVASDAIPWSADDPWIVEFEFRALPGILTSARWPIELTVDEIGRTGLDTTVGPRFELSVASRQV
ncbi:MAG: chitobiase/beta-hexosaminidase C-terminal domain-containing protein, partial [Verrucomicrobiales bacterium]|nr:chitobiase/beta-hexosaminidase C-terminal domain-containing protein [Verrucomicrobiales bacterium]